MPPIDAQIEFNPDPNYASEVLDECLRYQTLDDISLATGISRRLVSYFRHRGFNNYPSQITMELLAGRRRIED